MAAVMAAEGDLSMEQISFPDDFEEYRARATSGGSLFGLLRREAFARGSFKEKVKPSQRPFVRQRSRSMIPRSVALPEDKSILKVLCEYSATSQKPSDFESRRHSTACMVDVRESTRTRSLSPPVRLVAPRGPQRAGDKSTPGEGGGARPKGLRLPSMQENSLKPPDHLNLLAAPEPLPGSSPAGSPSLCRRRSFSLTPRGVVNEGDDLVSLPFALGPGVFVENPGQESAHYGVDRSRSNSCNSGESNNSQGSSDSPVHRVLMLGGPGAGKTALSQQFLTSEYMAAQNTSFDDGVECTVPVLLDGQESVMEFIDLPYTGDPTSWREYDVEAYIVVYSITDRRSYQKALDWVYDIQCSRKEGQPCTVVLVANKSDLERSRMVGKQEGKLAADDHGCKHIEVSAILNHKVDDLLVGTLEQVRRALKVLKKGKSRQDPEDSNLSCLARSKDNIFTKLFRFPRGASRSCENLLTS